MATRIDPEVTPDLLERFLEALPAPHRLEEPDRARLTAELASLAAEALAAYPTLVVGLERFLPYLAARLPPDQPLSLSLRRVRAADLYLACGCVQGLAEALGLFETAYLDRIDAALAGFRNDARAIEEVRDRVRDEVLLSRGGRGPKIAEYGGRGELQRWLKVVAIRAAVDWTRRARKELPGGDEHLLDLEATGYSPELAHFKSRYRQEFRRIFGEAMATLSGNQRNLLRYYHLDGLTLEQIAGLHQVHFSTIQRRLEKARAAVLVETRRRFLVQLGIGASEFESIMRVIESQFDASVARHLQHSAPAERAAADPEPGPSLDSDSGAD